MNGLCLLLIRAVLAVVALAACVAPAVAQEVVEYIHTDALGSPVAITDASGNVIERTVYEPYGAVVNRPLKDGPGYTGHVTDSGTGLSYMQQRYYDPGVGVFLSVDPVTAIQSHYANFQRYRYGDGNPYKFVDPDGADAIYFSDVNVLVIPVHFKGPSATKTNVEAIRSRVDSIASEYRGIKVRLQVLGAPGGAGQNSMNLGPGKDYANYPRAGQGVYGGIGGRTAHIDSSEENWIGAAVHDILHFAGAREGYRDSGSRDGRTSSPIEGYSSDHIMADRSGTRINARDEDAMLSNDTTSRHRLSDFKGFFRVEGRLDAKRLDKQLSGN
ncbi:hypothetical protein G3I15_37505 [Streptomyces sp. SID10244]|nr:hypothetical protein [Streptomyces sp. SID10244]